MVWKALQCVLSHSGICHMSLCESFLLMGFIVECYDFSLFVCKWLFFRGFTNELRQ